MRVIVDCWPMTEHDGPVQPRDVVKLPGGFVTMVVGVTFGAASCGSYVNGFWVGADERLELVRRPKTSAVTAKAAEG